MKFKTKSREHLKNFDISSIKKSNGYECSPGIQTGDSWVHLRTCQECGIKLCCDSSPNQHASKHFTDYKHPVITSAEPNGNWVWCYEHRSFITHENT
ncbi:UBP-type zinc finger domain-containing protein [Aquimarina sp. M1]